MKTPASAIPTRGAADQVRRDDAQHFGGRRRASDSGKLKSSTTSDLAALPRTKNRKLNAAALEHLQEIEESAARQGDGEAGPTPGSQSPLRQIGKRRDRDGQGEQRRDDERHGETAAPASGRRETKRSKSSTKDESGRLGDAKALVQKRAADPSKKSTRSESASELTDILLLASRHGSALQSKGMSPLQIQLLAVREYLGLGTPEDRRYLLSDVKHLLLERQQDEGGAPPPPPRTANSAEQTRHALLPLILLNALQRRNGQARERAQDKLDLVVSLNERARR